MAVDPQIVFIANSILGDLYNKMRTTEGYDDAVKKFGETLAQFGIVQTKAVLGAFKAKGWTYYIEGTKAYFTTTEDLSIYDPPPWPQTPSTTTSDIMFKLKQIEDYLHSKLDRT